MPRLAKTLREDQEAGAAQDADGQLRAIARAARQRHIERRWPLEEIVAAPARGPALAKAPGRPDDFSENRRRAGEQASHRGGASRGLLTG